MSVLTAKVGSAVDTGSGVSLVVNHRHDLRGEYAAEVTLTQDGRRYDRGGWHTGQEAEWVYVERWGVAGREFHGYVDSVSRKLLQSG
jgi:hypothetical protein